jgi:hypothetical protein
MKAEIKYGIQGAFKVDLYSGDSQEMVYTTDWFNNFITPTGLMMPLTYSFADCFRYLSLGRSSIAHSGGRDLTSLGTTGLYDPVSSYATSLNTSQIAQYIDWRGYSTGINASNCGSIVDEAGLRLFRGWQIPTGAGNPTMNEPEGGGLTISEFMVSPSSGSSALGKYAFSRVLRNLFIPNGYRAIISYQLRINVANTGITTFGPGTFATGNAEVENDANLLRTWANLSGYYKQVYHGLRQVDNLGMTYVPALGDGMEPASRNIAETFWYLSPDNSQYDVERDDGGGPQTSVANAYKADGLMRPIKQFALSEAVAYTSANSTNYQTFYNNDAPDIVSTIPDADEITNINIRIGQKSVPLILPELGDYRKTNDDITNFTYQNKQEVTSRHISYATPGVNGFDDNRADFGKRAVFSSTTIQFPINMTGQNLVTGRRKTITRRSLFSPVSSLGYNTRFGSLVYAYRESSASDGDSTYFPIIDCLFLDSSGRALLPHYRFITGIGFADRGTGIIDCYFNLSAYPGSVFKFGPNKTGFFGPYQSNISHPRLSEAAWTSGATTYYSGFLGSGQLNASLTGVTSSIQVNWIDGGTFTSNQGWGGVYGVIADSGFYDLRPDLGLFDHNTGELKTPAPTGQLYWPMVFPQYKLNYIYTGLKYYHPSLGFAFGDTGWFGSKQVVKDIPLTLLNDSHQIVSQNNFISNITGAPSAPFSGYYLTNKQFSGGSVTVASDVINSTTARLTGYIIASSITAGKLFGTVWKDTIPLDKLSFVPTHTTSPLVGATNAQRISAFFTGITDRGYPNGTGVPLTSSNEPLSFFVTGLNAGGPIYLTYLSGSPVKGQSFLSGTVNLTDFAPPVLHPLHSESYDNTGYRLATNFAHANYYGEDIYTASAGGEYPALSFDNGLEMYLNISWSSPCGPNVLANSCHEPV